MGNFYRHLAIFSGHSDWYLYWGKERRPFFQKNCLSEAMPNWDESNKVVARKKSPNSLVVSLIFWKQDIPGLFFVYFWSVQRTKIIHLVSDAARIQINDLLTMGIVPQLLGRPSLLSNSQCYKTFFGGNLENLDFPLSWNSRNRPF